MSRDDLVMRAGVVLFALVLLVIVGLPLWALLAKGFEDRDGKFVGLANYVSLLLHPGAVRFGAELLPCRGGVHPDRGAAGLLLRLCADPRPCCRRAGCSRAALIPIFAPSLLPGLALIYLFGNQGFFKGLLGGTIYGFDGIVIAQVFYCFPHVMMILVTALATADGRLYEAADALGASKLRVS